jgi:hypothetical protein
MSMLTPWQWPIINWCVCIAYKVLEVMLPRHETTCSITAHFIHERACYWPAAFLVPLRGKA